MHEQSKQILLVDPKLIWYRIIYRTIIYMVLFCVNGVQQLIGTYRSFCVGLPHWEMELEVDEANDEQWSNVLYIYIYIYIYIY